MMPCRMTPSPYVAPIGHLKCLVSKLMPINRLFSCHSKISK
uniref:Uncharacterized protein n=1 Tax=Arundo donax TaxID=35708 RepID=A0A0A9CJV9_ARUDO